MGVIGFFTPVHFGAGAKTNSQIFFEAVEDYLSLGDEQAHIIPGRVENEKQGVILKQGNSPFLLTVLKVVSYFTVILPLIALMIKAVSRGKFFVIDPKTELGKGIQVDQNLITKIQQLIPKLHNKEEDPQIEWVSKRHTCIFRLTEAPHLIFKILFSQNVIEMNGKYMNGEEQIKNRFNNMVRAKEVCLIHQLGLITLPHAIMFEVEAEGRIFSVIAEESLNVRATDSTQEELYRNHAIVLDQAVRQLAIFIAETGFSDVIWGNIPVIDEDSNFQGARRIGLIDLEHMESAKSGVLGSFNNGSCGLVRCLFSQAQIDRVLDDAKQRGIINQSEAQQIKAKRLEEIHSSNQLLDFYQRNGILTDQRKPIDVDLSTLGLNLEETGEIRVKNVIKNGTDDDEDLEEHSQRVTMREVAEVTIAEINRLIQKTADDESVKGKRSILLSTNSKKIAPYQNLGAPPGFILKDGEEKLFWLRKIIDALIEKGYLFKLVKENGRGYFIQA